jgi:hypothetical protein
VITIEIVTIEARSAGGRGTPAHREPRLSHIAGRRNPEIQTFVTCILEAVMMPA